MSNKPSMKNYVRIVYKTIRDLIFTNNIALIIIGCMFLTNMFSAYMTVKTTEVFGKLTKTFQTPQFKETIKVFLTYSTIMICFKYIPYMIFNYYMQNIQRDSYVLNLKETMDMDYNDFHSKTPGELHYAIFIKSFACPMTCQVILVDFASMVATVFFIVTKVNNTIDAKFAPFFIITPILFFASLYIYIQQKMYYHYALLSKEQQSTCKLTDKLLNYEAIKTYNLEQREANDFYNIVGNQTQVSIQMGKLEALAKYIMSFSINIPFFIMLIILFFNKNNTSNKDNEFLTLILLFITQTGELTRIGNDIDQLVEYLNQINFSSVQKTTLNENLLDESIEFNTCIKFINVSLMYKDRTIIQNINLTIKKGEKIGIVGTNGTGKSTFIKSLLGFTKYTGDIMIDDKIIKLYNKKHIFDLISYIPQDDCTSDDSVLNNLLLGLNRNDLTHLTKEEQIIKVKNIAKLLNAHSAFKNLENGYETIVGPRGNKLSGGQKQKISLVRAFLKDAPIFIFDEATASMDKKYEKEAINIALTNLNNKTVFMIVHGKDYLHKFDKIIFLDKGYVNDFNTYEHLITNNEQFKELLK